MTTKDYWAIADANGLDMGMLLNWAYCYFLKVHGCCIDCGAPCKMEETVSKDESPQMELIMP